MSLNRLQSASRQRGASLIEVLVSILIVSLGVIAMGGLLANATRLGKASEFRAISAMLASDMSDRIRANACAVVGNDDFFDPDGDGTSNDNCPAKSTSYDLTDEFQVLDQAPAEAAACANVNACTPAELAAIDVAQWQRSLYFGLPNGQGYIQYDTAGNAVDLWVAWLDPSALSNNEFQALDDLNAKNCPPGFQGVDPQPRCMYFRVAL